MTLFRTFVLKPALRMPFFVLTLATGLACATAYVQGQDRSAAHTKPVLMSSGPAEQEDRVHAIEAKVVDIPMSDKESVRLSLAALMALYKVPALSIAVVDDYKIAWAKGYGAAGADSTAAVTTRTLFQAGSISKPVAATGALYLVEHGKLALDEDVNLKLKTWKVPENEFTKDQKVTLRRLMSHTAGLTVHGFPGYDVDAPLPTLIQIFNGEKPANTAPIRVDIVPGTQQRYSGGGVTIEQQLMMDVTGKPFPELLRETVLDKIGMADSTYEQPLPPLRAAMTANGTYADGKPVHGKWHIYPEMAAAGLWTTPTDLAKFAIEIAQSRHGQARRVLSQKMTEEMLTEVKDGASLGFFVEKQNPGQFGHNGADEGFQALLTMNSETGKGVAIMADSDNGIAVADLVFRRVAELYAWNYKFEGPPPALIIVAKVRGAQAALDRYAELKKAGELEGEAAERALNQLGYTLLYSGHEQDAITVFKRNVNEYPESSNVYDSLGEAYAKVGEKDLAIANYERSLQLNPKNQNAVERLKKLHVTK